MIRIGMIATTSRYAVVAGSCLLMHNAIMITADRVGLTLLQAAATSFCIMVVTGYLLLSVFRGTRSWIGFARYTGAMAANFPISTGLAWLFLVPLHQPMAVAAPAATLIMVVVNYVASHWAILGGRASRSLGA
jgi:putative flippase GtrA